MKHFRIFGFDFDARVLSLTLESQDHQKVESVMPRVVKDDYQDEEPEVMDEEFCLLRLADRGSYPSVPEGRGPPCDFGRMRKAVFLGPCPERETLAGRRSKAW